MKPGSRARKAAATRGALLIACRVLFERDGYHQTSLRDIARAADVSTGAFFVHFADKAAAYRELYGHDPLTPEEGRYWRARAIAAGVTS